MNFIEWTLLIFMANQQAVVLNIPTDSGCANLGVKVARYTRPLEETRFFCISEHGEVLEFIVPPRYEIVNGAIRRMED